MKFRSDINGLRAIAVIAVVLFHFNPTWLPGGFAGVDVFFVISGFLMTRIILRGIEEDNFSLLKFYIARANRIIPALATLCFALLIFGAIYLISFDFKILTQHIVSSIGFISNIVYWQESGYFDTASKEKWLLHTWSLSAEWQFYIIYPLILVAARKLISIRQIKISILLGTIFAFICGIIATYKWPNAAYFLLPARAWEMMIGGVAYIYPLSVKEKKKKLIECLGLILILGSYLFISKDNLWPGYLAFIPVMGAFFVIQAQRNNSIITNNIIFQKIGSWSYSIYLWHWPIVVFGYYFEINNWAVIGIPISVLLGWLSFKYVENRKCAPLQSWKNIPSIYSIQCFLFICLIGSSANVFISYDIKNNPKKADAFIIGHHYYEHNQLKFNISKQVTYFNGAKKHNADFILIGDSNSAHYSYGISEGKVKVIQQWLGSCLPFIDYTTKPFAPWMNEKWENRCKVLYQAVDINKDIPIIIAQGWGARELVCISKECLLNNKPYEEVLKNQLNKLISYIGEQEVFIIGQVPAPKKSMVLCTKKSIHSCDGTAIEFHGNRVAINALLNEISSAHHNVHFINPFKAVCTDENFCETIINGKNIFFDTGHLSAYGSKILWRYIEKQLTQKR